MSNGDMTVRWYLGIDPGVSGGLALTNTLGAMETWKMPKTQQDLWQAFRAIRDDHLGTGMEQSLFAIIERVSAGGTSNEAGRRMGSVSAFTFGKNYGLLLGMLAAAGIPHDWVEPTKWQTEFGLRRRKDESQVAKKNRHKEKAQSLYPSLKIIHATADAVLIADYCRRIKQGLLERPQSKRTTSSSEQQRKKKVKRKVKKKVKVRRIRRRRKGAIVSALGE